MNPETGLLGEIRDALESIGAIVVRVQSGKSAAAGIGFSLPPRGLLTSGSRGEDASNGSRLKPVRVSSVTSRIVGIARRVSKGRASTSSGRLKTLFASSGVKNELPRKSRRASNWQDARRPRGDQGSVL